MARAVNQKLSDRFKQNFLADNKPGGGGNIGNEMAARAVPDVPTVAGLTNQQRRAVTRGDSALVIV